MEFGYKERVRTEINIAYSDIRFELHIVNEIVFLETFYSINSLAN